MMSRAIPTRPALLVLLVLVAFLVSASAHASEPSLFLSWHAPSGTPRASQSLMLDCVSMTRLDTLFMSMDPGESSDTFIGFTAMLRVQAMDGDTLSDVWDAPSSTSLPVWMKVEWVRDSTAGAAVPLRTNGFGGVACVRTAAGGRIIRMVYAVAPQDSSLIVGGRRYGLARFILRRPGPGPGCRQPACIQWVGSILSRIAGRHVTVVGGKGATVTLNAAADAACPALPASQAEGLVAPHAGGSSGARDSSAVPAKR